MIIKNKYNQDKIVNTIKIKITKNMIYNYDF